MTIVKMLEPLEKELYIVRLAAIVCPFATQREQSANQFQYWKLFTDGIGEAIMGQNLWRRVPSQLP
jgi:hypothetical protein